jgi:hypothetical protein
MLKAEVIRLCFFVMINAMKLAISDQAPAIRDHYEEVANYANTVGFIDWPSPFPIGTIETLVSRSELYVWGDEKTYAKSLGKSGMRLDCLADNDGLCRYYSELRYTPKGLVTFWSRVQQEDLTVSRFELEF